VSTARSALARARRAAGLSQEDFAERIGVDRRTVQRWETGKSDPHPVARRALAEMLHIGPADVDAMLGDGLPSTGGSADDRGTSADDEIDALDLARRAAASDVGTTTLDLLDEAVDDLASSYATTPPVVLLDRTRMHLRYLGALLDGRMTLAQHQRLLVAGGWLSLLAATLHIDLEQQGAAIARLRTTDTLAREAGHPEIRAWRLETDAWRVLTLGEYRHAVTLAQTAQRLAPVRSSARIQATAQEGRAWARLGDGPATTRAVASVNRMADPLALPDRPEHHYRYDPGKATSYTATTLSWVGDPAAVDHAREVIARLEPGDVHGGRPRRLAVARLDLALALLRQGEVEEAVGSALTALTSGHVAPSNRWRAREVIETAGQAGTRDAGALRDAYRVMVDQRG
jgi:transcriptional regulator with XRE-family HTH domain